MFCEGIDGLIEAAYDAHGICKKNELIGNVNELVSVSYQVRFSCVLIMLLLMVSAVIRIFQKIKKK